MEISEHKAHDSIINLLNENFINYKEGGLNKVYQQLIDYSKDPNGITSAFESISKNNLNLEYLEGIEKVKESLKNNPPITNYQTDLPIYIKSRTQNAKTIMICAMDPMSVKPSSGPERNSPVEYSTDRVDFWVPFSLIRNDKGANADFFKELSLHYNLYITDIYKLFFYVATNEWDDKNNKYKFLTSNSRPEYKKIRKHAEILEEEIKIIQPYCIITLGNNSRNTLLKTTKDKPNSIPNWSDIQEYNYISKDDKNLYQCKIISSPHISGSANEAKACLIQNYNNIIEGSTTKKMAKIIISKIESIK